MQGGLATHLCWRGLGPATRAQCLPGHSQRVPSIQAMGAPSQDSPVTAASLTCEKPCCQPLHCLTFRSSTAVTSTLQITSCSSLLSYNHMYPGLREQYTFPFTCRKLEAFTSSTLCPCTITPTFTSSLIRFGLYPPIACLVSCWHSPPCPVPFVNGVVAGCAALRHKG